MGLALDEPKDSDRLFHEIGFDVVIDEKILARTGGVSIQARPNRWIGTELIVTPNRVVSGICH